MALKLDMGKFQKISSDKHYTTLKHQDGHEIKVAHGALSRENRRALHRLPMSEMTHQGDVKQKMAEGGQPAPAREPSDKPHTATLGSMPNLYARGGEIESDELHEQGMMAKGGKILPNNPWGQNDNDRQPVSEEAYFADGETVEKPKDNKESELPNDNKGPVTINIGQPAAAPQNAQPGDADSALQRLQGATANQGSPAPSDKPELNQSASPTAQPQQPPQAAPQQSDLTQQALAEQTAGIIGKGQHESDAANKQAQVFKQAAQADFKIQDDIQQKSKALMDEARNVSEDIKNTVINPNRYTEHMNFGQKISTGVGLILGGIGSGLTHQENPVLKYLNNQIDRDIDSQKANLGKKQSLLGDLYKQYGTMRDAADMYRLIQADRFKNQLQEEAAKSASPLAKDRALQALGELHMAVAPHIEQMATRQMLQEASRGPGPIKMDPAKLISQMVPEKKQEAIYKEVERAQNTARSRELILQKAKDVIKDFKAARGAGRIAAAIKEPRSLQELRGLLGTTVTDLTGTARQAEFNNINNNFLPQKMDTDDELDNRLPALDHYLGNKSSAPRFKDAIGVDIHSFEGTSRDPMAKLNDEERKLVKAAKANPSHPNAKLILKKYGLE